jgi:serine O-acetyltransferase
VLIDRMAMQNMGTPILNEIAMHPISATEPDWSREFKPAFQWDPGKSLVASLRSYERSRLSKNPFARLSRMVAVLRHRFWTVVTGADIPLGTPIGGGLMLPHPNGIVIHPSVVVGPNCLIFQQVTLSAGSMCSLVIGGHVDIGAGAKVLGDITVGDHAQIGANAVVLKDVPANSTAIGIPARIINRRL